MVASKLRDKNSLFCTVDDPELLRMFNFSVAKEQSVVNRNCILDGRHGMDMSTPILPEVVPGENSVNFYGGWGRGLAMFEA